MYGEGKRAAEMLCAMYASSTFQPTIARVLCVRRPVPAPRRPFRSREFHPRRARRTADSDRRGRHTLPIVTCTPRISRSGCGRSCCAGQTMRPYNVGSSEALSILELARAVVHTCRPGLDIEVARQPAPGSAPQRYVPDITRAATELGLRPTVSLADGLARTFSWYAALGETAATRGTALSRPS